MEKHNSQEQTIPSGYIAHIGKTILALNSNVHHKAMWSVDLGAIDHMTGNPNLLIDIKPCSLNIFIRVADGKSIKVEGIGTAHICAEMMLRNVLYAPGLKCSLLSVRTITQT